jgi:hypothetical protein
MVRTRGLVRTQGIITGTTTAGTIMAGTMAIMVTTGMMAAGMGIRATLVGTAAGTLAGMGVIAAAGITSAAGVAQSIRMRRRHPGMGHRGPGLLFDESPFHTGGLGQFGKFLLV